MSQLTEKEAVTRAKAAWKRKQNWESTLGDAMRMVHPHRDGFNQYAPGQKKEGQQTWDATASLAAHRGANQLMGLTPAFEDWIVLEPGPAAEFGMEEGQLTQLRTQLQAISKQANAMCQTGEFASAVHEMWLDFLYSTGAMTVDANPDPTGALAIFTSCPLSEFMVEEGRTGEVDTWHRRIKMKLRSISIEWPDAKIPEPLERKLKSKPDEEVELFELTYRDYDESEKPWRYEVFYSKGSQNHRLVARQERTRRWMTPRNAKVSGEELGRGPLLQAMPDIRTLNTIVELTMRAASLALLGIYTSTEDATNSARIRLRPGAVIRVRSNGGPMGPSLQRLDQGQLRLDFADVLTDALRMNIKQALFDNGLPPDAGPVRSATEIVQRMRQLAVDLGGTYGRIVNEFVVPLVQRLIDIMQARGVLKTKLQIDQFFVRVRVSSQVARAQLLGKVEDLVRWLEIMLTVGGKEAIMVNAAIDQVFATIGQMLGVDERLIAPEDKRKETIQNLQQIATREVAANQAIPPSQGAGQQIAA